MAQYTDNQLDQDQHLADALAHIGRATEKIGACLAYSYGSRQSNLNAAWDNLRAALQALEAEL